MNFVGMQVANVPEGLPMVTINVVFICSKQAQTHTHTHTHTDRGVVSDDHCAAAGLIEGVRQAAEQCRDVGKR